MCKILREGSNNSPTSPHTLDPYNKKHSMISNDKKRNTTNRIETTSPPSLPRTGSNNNIKNFVDLNSNEYHINGLKYCSTVTSLIDDFLLSQQSTNLVASRSQDTSDQRSNVLIFDLSPNESAIPSLFTASSPASSLSTLLFDHNKSSLSLSRQNFFKFHLNLPSTLLKRKNFKFENLLQITFNDEKRKNLLKLIDSCDVFVFFDKFSTLSNCSFQTFSLITKFIKFLKSINKSDDNSKLILLSLDKELCTQSRESNIIPTSTDFMSSQITNNKFINNLNATKRMKDRPALQNFNLTIKIPKNSTNGMFVHSIKKDSIHYSPMSLKKYFTFNIPNDIHLNDSILPKWLFPFTDKKQKDDILLILLKKFDLLEDMEVKRLADCIDDRKNFTGNYNENYKIQNNTLMANEMDDDEQDISSSSTSITTNTPATSNSTDLQSSSSYHKIYSLTHLQNQFKKQKRDLLKRKSTNKISRAPSLHRKSNPRPDTTQTTIINGTTESKTKGLQLPPLIITDDNQQEPSPTSLPRPRSRTFSNNATSDLSENILNSSNSDTLMTPLVHYEVSQGIESFNKNRYSNILPYEHSRVKLQYSPLINNNNNNNTDFKSTSNNNTTNNNYSNNIHSSSHLNEDNIPVHIVHTTPSNSSSSRSRSNSNSNRKRKNSSSYFALNNIPQFNQNLIAPRDAVSPTSSLSSYSASPLVYIASEDNDSSKEKLMEPQSLLDSRDGSPAAIIDTSSSLKNFDDQTLHTVNVKKSSLDENNQKGFNDYINANYLSLPQINSDYEYIATQAPLPSTIDDFWKVIMSNKVKVIVSLNSDDELQHKKWDIYWGTKYNRTTQRFTVNIVKAIDNVYNLDGCTLRVFQVVRNNITPSEYCVVYQLQYSKWLDSCSADMGDLQKLFRIKNHLISSPIKFLSKLDISLDMISDLTTLQKNCSNYRRASISKNTHNNVPLLVHCSAGCGRTGVFITLDFLVNILTAGKDKNNKIDVWNMDQDLIFIVINELRKQRISMVQNLTQYISCYESMLKYFSIQKSKNEIKE
ncbi:similar to Saccharomyces cerevisiae YOR208W PTP2 Phosphotyrosine-specific protein phosphatase involved in the inactivation of mitogen-activated protein kinase (MAPK) during osmolarity sensing [Maudiozyma saulgeensis]|uniref:Similar to Saccharomyces cerevisiae YOR208W PTP2 Phosphotyrosine-specific protein phosphatase involved in the inactivation of mitogen-activated protein kinase (MAPK) during osmolarity sensing n=1 Tax=Maudiozyma saulgeensis TaxID=1789683 RepID=A0A1X7R905_9SACH|nr:similar to Saccharomyces cerevisiae YOR208W PTP2 Phosphotyrosine-specific protein phosphatase involved in the inactivation of mitogen-activated protein kinase (MAPK) during osmolarity sensing [Kazachstania saulgeensis]